MERDRLAAQGTKDSMDAAHRRDYAQKARIDMLRAVLGDFLDDPPSRVGDGTRRKLRDVLADLDNASAGVVLAWN